MKRMIAHGILAGEDVFYKTVLWYFCSEVRDIEYWQE